MRRQPMSENNDSSDPEVAGFMGGIVFRRVKSAIRIYAERTVSDALRASVTDDTAEAMKAVDRDVWAVAHAAHEVSRCANRIVISCSCVDLPKESCCTCGAYDAQRALSWLFDRLDKLQGSDQ